MIKWIAAIAGFFFYRFPGAILGFVLGSIIDSLVNKDPESFTPFGQEKKEKVSLGDLELNLLSLASLVIKADGSVSRRELDYVRSYFVATYGKERANATFRTFNDVIKNREISAYRIGAYLSARTHYATRLHITHFLFNIANSDGRVSDLEAKKIKEISGYLRVNLKDFESLKAMFFKSADNAYKILEIEKSATNAEVKAAFRTMAKKYHPDKLQHMDAAYRAGAEEKFRKVQEAYEQIQKERGM